MYVHCTSTQQKLSLRCPSLPRMTRSVAHVLYLRVLLTNHVLEWQSRWQTPFNYTTWISNRSEMILRDDLLFFNYYFQQTAKLKTINLPRRSRFTKSVKCLSSVGDRWCEASQHRVLIRRHRVTWVILLWVTPPEVKCWLSTRALWSHWFKLRNRSSAWRAEISRTLSTWVLYRSWSKPGILKFHAHIDVRVWMIFLSLLLSFQ